MLLADEYPTQGAEVVEDAELNMYEWRLAMYESREEESGCDIGRYALKRDQTIAIVSKYPFCLMGNPGKSREIKIPRDITVADVIALMHELATAVQREGDKVYYRDMGRVEVVSYDADILALRVHTVKGVKKQD